jgi:hypothetical protein
MCQLCPRTGAKSPFQNKALVKCNQFLVLCLTVGVHSRYSLNISPRCRLIERQKCQASLRQSYRKRADECCQQADRSIDAIDKARWLKIAEEWLKLAEEADRPSTKR